MMRFLRFSFTVLTALIMLVHSSSAQTTVSIEASKDNSLFSESGAQSNGAGSHLFAGQTNLNNSRRALVYFDLSGKIPAGVTIENASLRLVVNKVAQTSSTPVKVHRLLFAWGEAGSDADDPEGKGAPAEMGDATWANTYFDTASWSAQGGDFEAIESASIDVSGIGPVIWEGPGIVTDVELWLEDSSKNHGWILVADESTLKTAKRYTSRENSKEADRPSLSITYTDPSTSVSSLSRGNSSSLSAYPNPFSENINIRYSLDAELDVRLGVYNLLGQEIHTIFKGSQSAGNYNFTWDASDRSGQSLSDGMYYLILSAGKDRKVAKILKTR